MTNAPSAPLAAWHHFRRSGPAFWADFSSSLSVVGSLEKADDPTRGEWRGLAREALLLAPGLPPWMRGVVGWFGYEAGAAFERMPEPVGPRLLPDAWWGRIRAAAAFDRAGRLVAAHNLDEAALRRGAPLPPPREPLRVTEPDPQLFLDGVATVLDRLRRGDCYQVNLSRRLVVHGPVHPLGTWLRLRASNPSRRGLLLDTDEGAVICNSPELLLRARGSRLLSVPIKGTAPLSEPRRALLGSAKERAELTMIVDLVRSDLGRVAAAGTVVTGPRRVGRVGHVWHAMQRVEARLADGLDAVDAFAALFPPGSVTGAPKVRAMEVIRALEPAPRGVYCGSLGWFGPGGADANVAIRTISVRGDEAHVQVGAGIVLGSNPERELAECRLKAERMLAAL